MRHDGTPRDRRGDPSRVPGTRLFTDGKQSLAKLPPTPIAREAQLIMEGEGGDIAGYLRMSAIQDTLRS